MSNHSAPATVVPASTSAEDIRNAVELSIMLAMRGDRVDMPEVLVGTLNLAGDRNMPKIHTVPVAEVSVEVEDNGMVTELAEGETIVADLRDDMIMFETADDIAEVVCLTEDVAGMVWVVFNYSNGEQTYAAFDLMAEGVQVEILAAWDRATVKGLRQLVAA